MGCLFGGGAGIDEIPGDAAIDEEYALTRQAFAIEGRALLQRMVNVVGDGDVLSKELLAQAFVQAGAFVLQGSGGEIVKKKADEIEHGGGFENYRVASGRKLARVDGDMRFFTGARGEFLWIEGADVRGVGFGPARGRAFLHGNGKLGVGFAIGGKETARIA